MFAFFLRRIQQFILPLKVSLSLISLISLIYLIIRVPPDLGAVVIFSLVLFIFLAIILSFFLAASPSLLAALALSFFLFFKAVDLLSPINLGLFTMFLVLLGLYLRKK